MIKYCSICNCELILGGNWRQSVYIRKHNRCNICISNNRKQHYIQNKEIILKKNAEYRKTFPEKLIFSRAKARAVKQKLEFDITLDDIVIPTVCPVFKEPFTFGKKQNANSASLDRIDSSKGYIKGNVQVISHLANTMKSNATKTQLLQFSEWVQKCL